MHADWTRNVCHSFQRLRMGFYDGRPCNPDLAIRWASQARASPSALYQTWTAASWLSWNTAWLGPPSARIAACMHPGLLSL